MPTYTRFALYYAPEPGPIADFAAGWLGWDPATGAAKAHPDLPGLPRPIAAMTAEPRKYGFHATLKAPFRLAPGQSTAALAEAVERLAGILPPLHLQGIALTHLDGFLALTPMGATEALEAFAQTIVEALDRFRAPLARAELQRRLASPLTLRQRLLLDQWGYPYVSEQFRFHLTLTGRLPTVEAAQTAAVLSPLLAPLLPAPYALSSLGLFAEVDGGLFHILHRFGLKGRIQPQNGPS